MSVANLIVINPVVKSLELLGDRWTILILRDAFFGRRRFEEFRSNTGASRSTLSKRLEALVEQGVLYKKPYQSSPPRNEYRLTDKGLALYPWALMIREWESQWGDSKFDLPAVLRHRVPGHHDLRPKVVCRHCRGDLALADVERQVLAQADESSIKALKTIGNQRRSRGGRGADADNSLAHIAEIIGDRWASLVVAAAFMGLQRYDDFRKQLGIATNILADRLKRLTEAQVFERIEYQSKPPRSDYHLTAKGQALFPFTMLMRQWSMDWLDAMEDAPFRLIHRPCGQVLNVDVICQGCNNVPKPVDVEYAKP
ncbi:MAG: helix-turn-helix transcriptional regulator [Cellvibrionaceae bacterium]|nr:helix-turn-helix transcriptional regulator [Cellvibrionaceae bacterium]MCV6626424.1 helix-turn-helix transcriptional regulator [Cellvibrionaceae bacterium]